MDLYKIQKGLGWICKWTWHIYENRDRI